MIGIVVMIVAAVGVAIVLKQASKQNAFVGNTVISSGEIKNEDVYQNIDINADLIYDYSNKNLLEEQSDIIATVRIKTVNYTNFELNSKKFLTWAATIGELEIIDTEKGNFKKR